MIEPSDKKRVKEVFSDWLELQNSRKELTESSNDLRKEAANLLQVKPEKVTKLFNFMKKLYQEGEDELGDLTDLIAEIKD
jgi:hypothetical protein